MCCGRRYSSPDVVILTRCSPIVFYPILLAILTAGGEVLAHDLERTQVSIAFAADGSFVLDVANDPNWLFLRLEPFAGPVVRTTLSPHERDARLSDLASVFIDRIVLFVDGREVRPASAEYLPARPQTNVDDFPPLATYRLRGRVSADSRSMRWFYGLVVDPYPLTLRRADRKTSTQWINGANWSGVLDLSGQFQPPARLRVALQYLQLGYTHILPKGIDHILFVLGIFLLSTKARPISSAGDDLHGGALHHARRNDVRARIVARANRRTVDRRLDRIRSD